jgi:hypothetical protein
VPLTDLAEPSDLGAAADRDANPHVRPSGRDRIAPLEYVLCSVIVLFGASIRLPGLTSGDLWDDDAWIVLPIRVGLREAMRMDVSTPLFLLAVREWALLNPSSTAFIQMLPLAASLLTIAAVWWLVRVIGGRMWTRVLVALMVAVSPEVVEMSTRIKEFSVETLLGLLLLVVLVKAIESPAPRRSIALLGLSVVACLTSGILVLFVAGVTASYVLQGLRTGRQRDRWWITTVAGSGLAMLGTYLAFYSHIPTWLNFWWSPLEFNAADASQRAHTIGIMGLGIAHGFAGVPLQVGPIPDAFALTAAQFSIAFEIAVVVFAILFALMVAAVWLARSAVSPQGTAGLASVGVLALAVAAAVTGHAPLGGGRTDLWWYPAVWCLIAIVIEAVFRRTSPIVRRVGPGARRALAITSAVALVAIVVPYGIHFRAWYPVQDVRALFSQHKAEIRDSDWVYVSPPDTYAWALYGLGPFHIRFDSGRVHTLKGWRVSVDKFDVQHVMDVAPETICEHTKRIWWIGVNASTTDPNHYRWTGAAGLAIDPAGPQFTQELSRMGWSRSQVIVGSGVNAILYTHPKACAASPPTSAG